MQQISSMLSEIEDAVRDDLEFANSILGIHQKLDGALRLLVSAQLDYLHFITDSRDLRLEENDKELQ